MVNAFPSRNTSQDNTLAGVLKLFGRKLIQKTDDMLPAQVIAYNRSTNRAQVQPLIVQVDTLGNQVNRAQIASVPVLQIGGGGFVMSIPINSGDLGWIKANDRDITFFKKTFASSAPNTQRQHNFSDAVFIPDSLMRNVTIASEDANNMVIQNLAGTVRISIASNTVKITAPTVTINAPTTTCTGDLVVDGDITVPTGNIIATSGDVTAQSISLHNHVHPGVMSGSSDTGTPI